MKTIIAGSRDFLNYEVLQQVVSGCDWNITYIISGAARGADALGEQYARSHNIPIMLYPANWDKYGVAAGHIRNKEMAENADALIAFWDGKSKGTKNMIDVFKRKRLPMLVYYITDEEIDV